MMQIQLPQLAVKQGFGEFISFSAIYTVLTGMSRLAQLNLGERSCRKGMGAASLAAWLVVEELFTKVANFIPLKKLPTASQMACFCFSV